jgi:hypothetical protein
MKNILSSISQQEKNRILEMHKTATRKNYLLEQETQVFDSNYFNTNKTGTVKFNPSKGFPEVVEVNNIPDSDYTFSNNWTFDDSVFTGRVVAGWKGNNEWKYVFDGKKLDLTPADGNVIPEEKNYGTITFNPITQ